MSEGRGECGEEVCRKCGVGGREGMFDVRDESDREGVRVVVRVGGSVRWESVQEVWDVKQKGLWGSAGQNTVRE